MALRAARLAAHTRAPSSGEAPGKLSSHAREGRLGTGAATSDHRRYAAIRSPSVLLAAAARRLMPLAAASAASAAALLLVRDAALAESLHARRRHLRQILLAHVQPPLAPAELGMRHVARLLWRRAARRRLPHRLAQHVRRGPLHAPHDQVHPRPNLAQRHVRRRRLGALLQLDGILPHPHNAARASAPSVGGAPPLGRGGEGDHTLERQRGDRLGWLAPEPVEQEGAQLLELDHILPPIPVELQQRLRLARGAAAGAPRKARHRRARLDAKLVHVKDAVVEAAAEDEVVRPLFRVRAESEERRIIFLAEKLERRGVLPRVDGVVPAEVLCVRLLQAEEVRQQLIDDSGRLLAAGEQRGARVFDELGLALREEATAAGRFCALALEAHVRGGAVAVNGSNEDN
eukprot:CAMPEP_0185284306 /NCGR_PEP_ID=MMETSP1363-20130426/1006_1 /TAXON_ID=38817 /ORGANISM="Gephyrocapsa oceanica, Strain RCC1303" /LENGTH=402 /DNA_ID=CAMNT_0027880015 /DNA_START=143 /DNA_END=1348 /DNA_ORIENTATION=-